VEQNINIAVQHLQLSGNTQLAILALTAADERLARAARPQFLPLRRALAHDLETLKMTPFVDLPGMSLRLESVMVSVDKLPLLLAFAPPEAVAPQNEEAGGKTAAWGMKFLRESWQEIRGMVRIQRFDRKEPVLLSTQQDLILRENIKLRLLNARLALLSHDQWTFHNELKTAHSWLTEYFNSEEKTVQAAMATLEQLAATEITVELPHPGDSLGALQTLKANRGNR
jgi:uroporphyrin-3 C-methyltransferase